MWRNQNTKSKAWNLTGGTRVQPDMKTRAPIRILVFFLTLSLLFQSTGCANRMTVVSTEDSPALPSGPTPTSMEVHTRISSALYSDLFRPQVEGRKKKSKLILNQNSEHPGLSTTEEDFYEEKMDEYKSHVAETCNQTTKLKGFDHFLRSLWDLSGPILGMAAFMGWLEVQNRPKK